MIFARFLCSLVFVALLPCTALADMIRGKVVGITDGDTVTILDTSNTQHKIRLMGIDAPEKKMPFGQQSKQNLSDLIFNKQVLIEFSKKDRYGRTVGKITLNGLDANLEQIKAGMAWHYKKYQNEQSPEDRLAYAQAEVDARLAKQGIWSNPSPLPPWDWRKRHKGK